MSGPRFGSVITAMVTPFDEGAALDVDGAAALARWLVAHGSDGLVLCGTTGESPVLTDDESVTLWRTVREAVDVPLLAGTGTNDTSHSVAMTRTAIECGVDGILAVTPYYSRPSQAGIAAHFTAMAEAAAGTPVVIYDIPVRTGRKVNTDTLLGLAHRQPNVAGVKDASGDPAETAHLVAHAPAGFEVYSGDDCLTLPLLAVGAVGAVSVAAHWAGELIAEMVAAFTKGDQARAREVNALLLTSYRYQTGDSAPNPIPTKVMMNLLGVPVGHCRLPLGPPPAGLDATARQVATELGLQVAT